jgi:hypothetical protein
MLAPLEFNPVLKFCGKWVGIAIKFTILIPHPFLLNISFHFLPLIIRSQLTIKTPPCPIFNGSGPAGDSPGTPEEVLPTAN